MAARCAGRAHSSAGAPGIFSLAGDGQLTELLHGAGCQDVVVSPVSVTRHFDALDGYLQETIDVSPLFGATYRDLSADEQAAVVAAITAAAQPYVADDGWVTLPGSSLVASAAA